MQYLKKPKQLQRVPAPSNDPKKQQVHCTWDFNFCTTSKVLVHPFLHQFQYTCTIHFFPQFITPHCVLVFFISPLGWFSFWFFSCYFWFISSVSMSNPFNARQESRFSPWRVKNIKKWKILKVYYVKKCIITFQHFTFSKPCHFLSLFLQYLKGYTLYYCSLPLPLSANVFPEGKFALISQKQQQVQNRDLWEVFIQLCTGICMICHVIVQQNFLCCLWPCL